MKRVITSSGFETMTMTASGAISSRRLTNGSSIATLPGIWSRDYVGVIAEPSLTTTIAASARSSRSAVATTSTALSVASAMSQACRWACSRGLAYFNEVDRAGHFAAWEEPELFSAEVRAAFSSVR